MLPRKATFLGSTLLFLAGFATGGEVIANWTAPAAWSPAKPRGGLTAMDATPPLPFIGLAPCRVADTRGNGFTGAYGPPSLVANQVRNFTIAGQCGVLANAAAVSFNFTALNVSAAGDLRVFPPGVSAPLVSTLNYNANTPNIANAAVVALNGGVITVLADATSIDLIIDVNGYYSSGDNTQNAFVATYPINAVIDRAGFIAMVGANLAVTGQNIGVFGLTRSGVFNSSAVKGADGTGTSPADSYNPAGVRGESSAFGNGVLGLSQFQGVAGSLFNSAGHEVAYGVVGFKSGANSYGVFSGGNFGGTGTKYFVDPHPTDASMVIRYVALEGPESGTYFRGRGKFHNGLATIEVPEDFRMVTAPDDLSIQVTPIGDLATVAVVRIDLEGIVVKASRNVEFFYTVNGVRRTHRDLKPIGPGAEFMPRSADARIPAYLTEVQKEMLVSNGTYNADGTVNRETAERLGWAKAWKDRE